MRREVDGRTGKEDKGGDSGRRGGRGSRRGRWRENGDEVDGGGGCEDGMERRYERGVCLVGFSDFEKPLVVFSIMSIIYELTGDGSEMVFPENTNRMYSVVGAKFSDSGFSYLGQALNGSITVSFILYAKFGLVLPYGTRLHFPFIAGTYRS